MSKIFSAMCRLFFCRFLLGCTSDALSARRASQTKRSLPLRTTAVVGAVMIPSSSKTSDNSGRYSVRTRCGLFLCAFIAQGASRSIYCIPKGFENYQGEINLFHNVSLFGQTSGTVLKKSVFNRTHRYIPHMIYHEDYLLIQAVALIAPVFYCGIPLNKYRGDVPGQTTQNPNTPQAEESKLMYYNIGMEDSLRVSEKGNESLNIYLRYFLFHDFKRRLSLKDNEALLRFIQRLSFDVKKLFYPFELSLIAHYPRVAILYINLTKVRWRLRRYPTWGDKCDLNKINPQYLNW